jgi:crotonobetaine/carnitine-CoA ligase
MNYRMSPAVASTDSLPHLLDALVKEEPNAPMLIDAATDRRVTRAQFDQENRAWARRLAALEVKPGDNVATMLGPVFDAYHAWLGLSGLGAVEVPINPQLRGLSLSYLLNHSQAALLVVQNAFLHEVIHLADSVKHLRTVVVTDFDVVAEPPAGLPFQIVSASTFRSREVEVDYRLAERHDTACIVYTSGTTGPPKGVVKPWGSMSTSTTLVPPRITGGARYSYLSPAHMSGKGALNNAVAEKRTLVLRETFSVREFWNDIAKYDCRVSQLFPPMIKYLLAAAQPSEHDRETPLQHIWIAPLNPEIREFMQRFGVAVTTGYGMTEIGGPLAGIDINAVNVKTCGTVKPDPRGYEVRLVDEFDREVGPNAVGELIVRASAPWTLNTGYYNNPQATADAWRNGWFHTGDAMIKDEDGNFYFIDRQKDCIRRKGENISSFELEAYALSYPGVAEAAAVGVANADGEQEVKIFLVAKTTDDLDLDAMGAWLSEHMPKFMVPRYLEILPAFPRTPATERIQKGALRALAPGPNQWDRLKSTEFRTTSKLPTQADTSA